MTLWKENLPRLTAHAAIFTGLKQLGIDQDAARDLYARVTGKRSLRDMSPREHQRIVEELRRQGFKAEKKGLQGPFAKQLQALWIDAWNLGIVRDRRGSAMLQFVKRQTNIDHTRFLLDAEDAVKAVEALKGWMKREAGVDWSDARTVPAWLRCPGAKIAVAQWQILFRAEAVPSNWTEFRKAVQAMAKPVDQMQDRDWIPVMNALGVHVRKAQR